MQTDQDIAKAALQVGEVQIPELKKFYAHILETDPGNLPALYGCHILAMRENDISLAITYFRELYKKLPYHPRSIRPFIQHFKLNRELIDFAISYTAKYPAEPYGYWLAIINSYLVGNIKNAKKFLADCYLNSKIGIHFQPSLVASLFDAANRREFTSVNPPSLPSRVIERLIEKSKSPGAIRNEIDTKKNALSSNAALIVSTKCGEFIGGDKFSLNGQVSGANVPTEYFFRYGASPEALSFRTKKRQVPPGRFGRVGEVGSNLFRRINAFGLTASFLRIEDKAEIGDVSMRLESPFGKDRNHRDGIGVIDLVLGWQTAVHLRGNVPKKYNSEIFPKPAYPGEALDLRDALFAVTYRSINLDAKDFYPVAWVHGGSGEAYEPSDAENYSAWALTSDLGQHHFLSDGDWHKSTFQFECNPNAWSFCGSNVEEMGKWMERICYHPISEVLRENRFGSICLCFVCGDEMKPPQGDIEIGRLELSYRSYSLLTPDQGADIISSPCRSPFNPNVLYGGWIGSLDHCWRSEENPQDAQEFVWQFRDVAEIATIRLHNDPVCPSREVALLISEDGANFDEIWQGILKDVPRDPAKWPNKDEGGVSFNFAKVIVFDERVRGQYLKLVIMSGFRKDRWGLDAIEVFGPSPAFIPSPEPLTVAEEICGLKSDPLFVQLIAENKNGKSEGRIIEVARPLSKAPIVTSPIVITRTKSKVKVRVRTNAMGKWSELSGTIVDGQKSRLEAAVVSLGKQDAAREAILSFEGLMPGIEYQGIAIATNEQGESEPCYFTVSGEEFQR